DSAMRHLIDNYISASDSEKLGDMENFTLLAYIQKKQEEDLKNGNSGSDKKHKSAQQNVAETIENNIRRKIIEKTPVNPKYYQKMSELFQTLIDERKEEVASYKEMLEKYAGLVIQVENPEQNNSHPESIRTSLALCALYDNFGEDEEYALALHKAVLDTKQDHFRGDLIKERQIKGRILMNINISGIDVQINKKNIKNMHLSVKPPLGNVVVSAPLLMSQKSIENFVRLNFGWIKKQQEKFANQPRMTARQYVSGETYYIWGKQFFLEFKPSQKRAFKIDGNKIILEMKAESTAEQRERFIREEFRKILIEQLNRLIPKWEETTGLYCDSFQTKYMLTRWGTCNSKAKRIWINLQMVEKPLECLEYIILHELTHLKVSNHGKDFIANMDKYMPDWKDRKNLLNGQILDSYKA
ncbi:MAG: SprT family zinc-dependent metalloprotease, partial [Spirochaetales bacterium]|nr:SprT family zinc-dependent metalloprotease [Spirochaetales bacterium]